MAEKIKLQKHFTDCGLLSRRAAEAEIIAGKVLVNGAVACIGDRIDPDVDVVEYQGKRVVKRTDGTHLYLMLHKPRGFVTTASDEKGRRTVLELVKDVKERVYPVGRLDMDSEGLLILTNDGDLTNRLTHPKHTIPKIYHVTVSPPPTKEQIKALSSPMELDGYRLQPVGVRVLEETVLEMTLYEGRNRQIRKMCQAVDLHVKRLCRVAIGELTLSPLPLGKWRHLTDREVAYLKGEQKTLKSSENHLPKGSSENA